MHIIDEAKHQAAQFERIHAQKDAANLARAAADAAGKAMGTLESDAQFRILSPERQNATRMNAADAARRDVYKTHGERLRAERDAAVEAPSKGPVLA